MVLDENSTDRLGCKKANKWFLEQSSPETSLEAKMTTLKLSFGHVMRRLVS